MIKESKYIIRKIIIGVGIALCLAFLNGCKVKAYTSSVLPYTSSNNTINYYENNTNFESLFSVTYNNQTSYFYKNNNENNVIYYASDVCSVSIDLADIDSSFSDIIGLNNSNYDGLFIYTTNSLDKVEYLYYNNISYLNIFVSNKQDYNIYYRFGIQPNAPEIRNNSCYISYYSNNINANASDAYSLFSNNNVSLNDFVKLNGMPIYDYYNQNEIIKDVSIVATSSPEFLSFNASKTVHDNLLLGYTFAPEFSVFDTDNYEYQYRIGLNDIWLTMNENLYEFNVNANTTVYVRIKDKSNNEIIDSSTFTITGVGSFVDNNVDYDIKFNGKYRTQNYLNNNSSGSSIIQEYEIDVTFSPDSSILKYQYQYVLNGNSIDNNGWIDVSLQPSNMGNFTTVVSQNGTLYARILDSSDNIMAIGSFTINSIGKIAFDNSNDKILNKYNNIANSINFAGPISGLIDIPIKVIGTIITGLAGGLTCSDYQLGRLMGTNLVIPCVNVKARLGESLYMTIDIILSACMAYHIIKMIFDLYNNLVFMEKNPVVDLGRRRS